MINLLLTLFFVFLPLSGTDIDPRLIMERSYNLKKPMTSIMDIEIEIIRKKGKKEKVKSENLLAIKNYMILEHTCQKQWRDLQSLKL